VTVRQAQTRDHTGEPVRRAATGVGRASRPRSILYRESMVSVASPSVLAEHAADNAMDDPGEIARFHDRCSDLMRDLLEALALAPDRPRTFPQIEDALGWPHRRIACVLGGVSHLRQTEFGGRRPYRFHDDRRSRSGRWEMWMDRTQAAAVRAAQRTGAGEGSLRNDAAS
jgi:hypothetical protein